MNERQRTVLQVLVCLKNMKLPAIAQATGVDYSRLRHFATYDGQRYKLPPEAVEAVAKHLGVDAAMIADTQGYPRYVDSDISISFMAGEDQFSTSTSTH